MAGRKDSDKRGHLVLNRKVGERIMIGEDVVVTILEIRGDRIQVGIEAPVSMPVHRSEIVERMRQDTDSDNKK